MGAGVRSVINSFLGEHDFLSNFYPAIVHLDTEAYLTVEHAYQAAKTNDPKERKKIRDTHSPFRAKQMGKKVTLRKDWESVKIDVMRKLVREKFTHIDLRDRLLATGDAKLVEGNDWNDTFWGVCNGKGENWLGRILMEVRDELQSPLMQAFGYLK